MSASNNPLAGLTAEQINALVALVQGTDGAPETPPTVTQGLMMKSLGFAVVGNGDDPGEGARVDCPTQSGKTARLITTHRIEPADFGFEVGWAYRYRRLKRGENA